MKTNIDIQQQEAVQKSLLKGVQLVDSCVGSTMGPGGRLVITPGKRHFPKITKDGVSVAEILSDPDPHVNLAVEMVIQACKKQVLEAGDGTTLTAVLTRSLFENGQRSINSGVNIRELIRELKRECDDVCAYLDGEAYVISSENELKDIAEISANGDRELGDLIGHAVYKVGADGFIVYKRTTKTEHTVEFDDGIRLDIGIEYTPFSNTTGDELFLTEEDQPLIVVTDYELAMAEDLRPIMQLAAKINETASRQRPVIIFTPDMRDYALKRFIKNIEDGLIKGAWIRPCKNFSQYDIEYNLQDIATITNATFFSKTNGNSLKAIQEADFGTATLIKSNPLGSMIQGNPDAEKLRVRLDILKAYIDAEEVGGLKKEHCEKSYARLLGGMATIHIGGRNDTNQSEILDRVDDAVRACVTALEYGVTQGGGVAFLDVIREMYGNSRPLTPGAQIIYDSLTIPVKRILSNFGMPGADLIIQKILEKGGAYDLENGYDKQATMRTYGVVDPVRVLTQALRNAVYVAADMLQTNCSIAGKDT